MTTQLFLLSAASDLGGAGQLALGTTRGGSSTTAVTNTATSGTNIQVTKTAAGQVLTWFSAPISGTPTVSSAITVNVRGSENSNSANACAGITIERTNGAGTVQSTIVANTTVTGVEYALTTDTAYNASKTPTSTTFTAGDRIKVTLFTKNVGTMASGHTTTNTYDGPSAAAAGDTYITLTETLSFVVNANVTGVGAAVTAAGGAGTAAGLGPWTAAGSLAQSGGPTSFSLTTVHVGDLVLVEVISTQSLTFTATALSSSHVTWSTFGTSVNGSTNVFTSQVFAGTVTSVSTATVTVTFSGGTPSAHIDIVAREFTSATGSWSLDVQGTLDSAGTNTWASLTPAAAGELYWGHAQDNVNAVTGSTTGFSYELDGNSNGSAYNLNCAVSAQAPVWGDSTQLFGQMVLVSAAGGGSPANVTGVAASITAAGGAGTPAGSVNVTGTAASVTVQGGAGTAAGTSPNANVTGVAAAVTVAGGAGAASGAGAVAGAAAHVTVAGGAGTLSAAVAVTGIAGHVTVAGATGTPSASAAVTGIAAHVTVAGGAGTPAAAANVTGVGAQVTVQGGAGTATGAGGGAASVTGVAAAVAVAGGAGTPAASANVAGTGAAVLVHAGAGTLAAAAHITGMAALAQVLGGAGVPAGGGATVSAVSHPTVTGQTAGNATAGQVHGSAVTEAAAILPAVTGQTPGAAISQSVTSTPAVSGG